MLELELHERFGENFNVKIWNTKVESKNEKINEYKQILNPKEKQVEYLKKNPILKEYMKELIEYNMDLEEYQRMKESELMYWTYEDETKFRLMQAKSEGVKEGKIETVRNMIAENLPIEVIMKVTELSKKEIEEYQK